MQAEIATIAEPAPAKVAQRFNSNKLLAALCIAASASVSIGSIFLAVRALSD
jgi:hypothetical protein